MNYLCKYVTNKKNELIGCVIAIGKDVVGVCAVHKEDRKGARKSISRDIALGRAMKFEDGTLRYFDTSDSKLVEKNGYTNESEITALAKFNRRPNTDEFYGINPNLKYYKVPRALVSAVNEMFERSERYFK